MDGLTLLEEAREAGLVVKAEGDRLCIRGPRDAERIAQRLIENKAVVLRALGDGSSLPPIIEPDDLPPDWRVHYEERAGIMEIHGGLTRQHAEARALADTLEVMRRRGTDFSTLSQRQ